MGDLVLFSGGCDSTLVLYNQAMELLKSNQSYNRVKALSINHNQVPSQSQQKIARQKIREEFEARQLPVDWIEVSITNSNGAIYGNGIVHPVIWLPTAALYLNNNESLYTGYHRGDCYWMFKDKAELAFINFVSVLEKTNITIKYPLQGYSKADIIRELKARKLYDMCWYCETTVASNDKPCGECTPCQTHRTALWQLDNLKPPKDYHVLSDEQKVVKQLCDTVKALDDRNVIPKDEIGNANNMITGS